MNEDLKYFLTALAPFSDEELNEAWKCFHPRSLKRKEHFCRQGSVSGEVGFVRQGILRSYFFVGEKEKTTFFQTPHTIVAALGSMVEKKPSLENIQALTDCELIVISRDDLYSLYEGDWKWQQVGRVIIESYYIQQEERLLLHQSLLAQERYRLFSEAYPEVLQRIPLQHVASYLGISPETLSRIRASK